MIPNNSGKDFAHVLAELQRKIQTDAEHLRVTKENHEKAIAEKNRLAELIKTKEMEIEKARVEISTSKSKISQLEREINKLGSEVRTLEVADRSNKEKLAEISRAAQESLRKTDHK